MLRPVSEPDISSLLEIERLTQPDPWSFEIFQRCLKVGYHNWVITEADQIRGFIIFSLHSQEMHILNLGVSPDFQRRGFGMALLNHAENLAIQQGGIMSLLEVRRSNQKAIALYEKLGFIQIGERKNYYAGSLAREDALIFAKDLRVQ